ncbi:MAG: radical SAM protein [Promethearchaeota archaeon]
MRTRKPLSPPLKINEVTAKSILNPSRISGVTYAINPYVGCQHACSYCYARFMSRYTGHQGEAWGSFVDIKINAPRVLQQQLRRRRKTPKEPVLFSSVTDAYQPLERRYEVTRNCLAVLTRHEFPISILTKSDLVLRDVDLLKQNSENEVGMTIISLDEKTRRVFESGAVPSHRRLDALREISSQGIRTYGFVGPIIPELSTAHLEELIHSLADCGVSYALFDRLNVKYGNRPVIEKVLRTHFEDQAKTILDALRPRNQYYEKIREKIVEYALQYGLEADIIF